MDQKSFFDTVVEPSSESLGVYGISHDVNFDGRHFVVTHKVSKTVMTEFDRRLSRYLAAVAGKGLPGASVETRIRNTETGRSWQPYPVRYTRGLTDALATAARLAIGSESRVRARVGVWMGPDGELDQERVLVPELVRALDYAAGICQQIGTIEFLDVSGDLARILVKPVDSKLDMLVMNVDGGSLSVPTTSELSGVAYQGPLLGFERALRQHAAVGTYLTRARHLVALAKEDAIYAFREAAESRIMEFDSALAGRDLTGHRLESARSLVARLQAGLGDTLLGLSEAAQLTALEWASEVRQLPDMTTVTPGDGAGAPRRPRLVR